VIGYLVNVFPFLNASLRLVFLIVVMVKTVLVRLKHVLTVMTDLQTHGKGLQRLARLKAVKQLATNLDGKGIIFAHKLVLILALNIKSAVQCEAFLGVSCFSFTIYDSLGLISRCC